MSNLQQYLYIIHQTDKNECNARLGATGVRQLPGAGRAPVAVCLSVCLSV